MVRPKQRTLASPRNTVLVHNINSANVVVFIPPAVDPGEPPISINTTVNSTVGSANFVKSTVLKPAVRGETAWNQLAII